MTDKKKKFQNSSASKKNKQVPESSLSNQKRTTWIVLAVIFLTTYLVYSRAVKYGFLITWDDNLYVTQNPDILNFNLNCIKLFFTKFYANNYQPLTMLFYALEYKLGSGSASIFHFINILLHILNSYLVFLLIRKISPESFITALITAAFFAVHPAHVKSVAWVAERKDLLYSFFLLLSLISYSDYLHTPKIRYLLLSGLFFVLSCLSKSAAVILPLLLLLLDYYTARKQDWKTIAEKIPFFAISLLFGLLAVRSQDNSVQTMAPAMQVVQHILIVCYSFLSYILKAFLPFNLSAFYPYPPELGQTLPLLYYLSIPGLAILLFFVWYSKKWNRDVLFGFLFFTITIILVLQILPVGAAMMADRYSYIPYIGIFFLAGKLFEFIRLDNDFKKYKGYALSVVLIAFVIFSAYSFKRVELWKNDEVFFSDIIGKYPFAATAYKNRGSYYLGCYASDKTQRNMFTEKAVSDFENLLKYSSGKREKAIAYNNIGVAKSSLGDFNAAVEYYSRSIESDPTWNKAYSDRGGCYVSYFANTLYAENKPEKENYLKKAIADYEQNMKFSVSQSENAISLYNIGCIKFQLGDYPGSIEFFNKAIDIDDKYLDAYNNRGSARNVLKDYGGAVRDFKRLIELNPKNGIAWFNLGVNQFAQEDYVNAIGSFSKSILLNGEMAIAYSLRGNSYLKLKRYAEAIRDYDTALKLDPSDMNSVNNRNIALSLVKN